MDEPHRTIVDDIKHPDTQFAEVAMDSVNQVLGCDCPLPRLVRWPSGAELCNDDEPRRIGVDTRRAPADSPRRRRLPQR